MPAPAAPMEAMAEGMGGEAATTPIRTRIDFNPLAVFAPSVRTDANGEATVEVSLPDNLTRYRIMVVAVASGNQFGITEANLTARLPLMVRPSAPRFLNFGDRFELPVVLQNQTGEPMLVDVVLQVANLELTGSKGLRVEVPARDRVEVRFPAAAQRAGIARLQVVAVSGNYADAAQVELPVYTPATTEAFATYGVVDQGAIAQPVSAPSGVFPQYGGLEINTSSTALQSLTDAVLYLVSYPFECSEQLASRILAVAALRDVLTAFEAEGLPSPQEMEAAVARDIEVLRGLQNDDGGYPYWWRGADSVPFNTIHVAHALQRAKLKGFEVPQDTQQRLLEHLRNIESYYPHWYSRETRWTLSAYALYVRDLMGDPDPTKAMRLLDEAGLEQLSLDAIGWLWPVLQDAPGSSTDLEAMRRYVNNRVVETAGAANFTTSYDDQTYLLLSSDRRTDAILLDALIDDSPDHDLIPKLVNGLMAHRTRGRWGNTQENVFVLLALDRYFNTYESQTPDFVARVWLGDAYAGEHEFRGRTTERHETLIPMSYLLDESQGSGLRNLILSKDGEGRLYYRLGLRYAPDDLELDPLDMGFVVRRSYEGVDNPEDVYRDESGVWHIKAGTRVRVRLSMVADNRRYHVALVDPLPAGLEIVNPSLAVSGSIPQDPTNPDTRYGWWWWGPWYEHQNLRDERAEAFTPLLWDGVYEYTYIARATTPGRFIVPPAKAEEMYSPEVFGRSSSMVVIVE
jgi:alpha-2-macroglobulin